LTRKGQRERHLGISNRKVPDHAERDDVLLARRIFDRAERVEDGLLTDHDKGTIPFADLAFTTGNCYIREP
jgi:hypothetical protein